MEFQCVRTVAQQMGHTPNSGNPYSYKEYKTLLLTVAESYNAEKAPKKPYLHSPTTQYKQSLLWI